MGFSEFSGSIKEVEFFPIEYALDGTSAPDAVATFTDTNGVIRYRDFAGDSSQDVRIPWRVPSDCIVSKGITFKVHCIITNATGPSSEEIEFKLSGYCSVDNDPLNGTFGTEVASNKTSFSAVQNDVIETPESSTVTIPDLARGGLAMLKLYRDHDGNDNYVQKIGVTGVTLIYDKEL